MLALLHNKTVQALSAWLTVAAGGFAVLSRLTPEWFGTLTWPQSILLGIFLALATGLILAIMAAVGGYGFRLFRPIESAAPQPGGGGDPPDALKTRVEILAAAVEALLHEKATVEAVDEASTALRETIRVVDKKARDRLDVLETQYPKVIDDYQRMLALEARLEPVEINASAALRDFQKMRDLEDRFKDRFDIIERRITEGQETSAATFNALFLALQAIRAREKLAFYAGLIEEYGQRLRHRFDDLQPIKGDDWAEWEMHHQSFEGALGRWVGIAKGWHPKIGEWIDRFDRTDLTGARWDGIDALFDGSNHSTVFKGVLLRFERWKSLKSHADVAVHLVAFGGPDALAQLDTVEGGPPTIDRVQKATDD